MSCSPQFSDQIPYSCLLELVSDIRNGAAPAVIGKKLLWVAGSALEAMDGEDRLMGASEGDEAAMAMASNEELLGKLEEFASSEGGGLMAAAPGAKVRLPAWLLPLLLQLIQRWLAGAA